MTIGMYAKRKDWHLSKINVSVVEEQEKNLTIITKIIHLEGDLDDEQHKRLLIAAERCPVNQLIQNATEVRLVAQSE